MLLVSTKRTQSLTVQAKVKRERKYPETKWDLLPRKVVSRNAKKKKDHNNSLTAASFCMETMNENAVSNSTQTFECMTDIKGPMWLIDSGCNRHISPRREDFQDVRPTDVTCIFGNKGHLKAEGIGDVEITTLKKGKKTAKPEICQILLKDVLYIPESRVRLLSSGCLRRTGGKFIESSSGSTFRRLEARQ